MQDKDQRRLKILVELEAKKVTKKDHCKLLVLVEFKDRKCDKLGSMQSSSLGGSQSWEKRQISLNVD